LNTHPDSEFDGIFDNLTPQDFTPVSTVTYPTEYADFNEFVDARLDALRPAYAPGKTLTHAALTNSHEVRQIAPDADEELVDYLKRLRLHAQDMRAESFFFCRIVDASSVMDDVGFCVLWIAHHVQGGEQVLRTGIIPIKDKALRELQEVPHPDPAGGPIGELFTRILQP
jgi:hypothetical protein